MVLQLHSLMPPSFYSLAAAVRWVSVQHLNPETAFNLRWGEAGPFWIVGFHNCQAAKPPPPENRESWEFNYDGILALDPAGLNRRLMGGLTKTHPGASKYTLENYHSLSALSTVCPSLDTFNMQSFNFWHVLNPLPFSVEVARQSALENP